MNVSSNTIPVHSPHYEYQLFSDCIWFKVLEFLPTKDFVTTSLVSKQLKNVQNHPALWKIHAKILNIFLPQETEIQGFVKTVVTYRKQNMLFRAVEPIFPYHVFKALPQKESFIPLKIEEKLQFAKRPPKKLYKQYLETTENLLYFPALKISDNQIEFHAFDHSQQRVVRHILCCNTKYGEFVLYIDYLHAIGSFRYKDTASKTHTAFIDYIGRLLRRESAGSLSTLLQGDYPLELIENERIYVENERIDNGKSRVELPPTPDNEKLAKLSLGLQTKFFMHYK